MKLIKNILKLLNSIKIKLRHRLSHWPIFYAFLGSIGVVLIWRGVWGLADEMHMSNIASLIIGCVISISTGLFVSFFVGDQIIISGIKQEKRIDEKTEAEIKKEEISLREIKKDLKKIREEIDEIDEN